MAERIALAKFSCPSCGGEANWHAGRQKLVCPYCGTDSEAPEGDPSTIVEHDLAGALRSLAGQLRGWQTERRSVRCQSCRAISVLDPTRQAQNCEFCGSAQLVPYEETEPAFAPQSVVPFKVSAVDARDRIRAWYGKLWFAPNALKRKALTDTVHGIYLPYWTFDARVSAQWTAESGRYHYADRVVNRNGRAQTQRVREIRWSPAAGSLEHFFDDDLVCSSVGVHPRLLRGIEPFPMQNLRPYDPGYVSGWVVERYQVPLPQGAERSRAQMNQQLVALCGAQVPGDTYRNLHVRADWRDQTFKHVLAPVWLLSYDYGRKSYQCVINGASGSIQGEYPKSPWKIALAVLAAIVVLIIVASVQR